MFVICLCQMYLRSCCLILMAVWLEGVCASPLCPKQMSGPTEKFHHPAEDMWTGMFHMDVAAKKLPVLKHGCKVIVTLTLKPKDPISSFPEFKWSLVSNFRKFPQDIICGNKNGMYVWMDIWKYNVPGYIWDQSGAFTRSFVAGSHSISTASHMLISFFWSAQVLSDSMKLEQIWPFPLSKQAALTSSLLGEGGPCPTLPELWDILTWHFTSFSYTPLYWVRNLFNGQDKKIYTMLSNSALPETVYLTGLATDNKTNVVTHRSASIFEPMRKLWMRQKRQRLFS